MFRKILIAFVLLVVLAGFSYVKTSRDYAKQDAILEKAKSEISEENKSQFGDYKKSIDSLSTLIVSKDESFNKSLTSQKNSYESDLDSLESIISNQSAKITKLSKRPEKKKQTASKVKKKPKQLSEHEKIYRYYKKRYTDLPEDLSTYERKIALSEIREETASKFSISLNKLSKIRKEYKLNY